jgi:tetratricopeptide (TPR) repeat protein
MSSPLKLNEFANPDPLFKKGLEAIAASEWSTALACFEKATALRDIPLYSSYLALCIARERGQTSKGISMCMAARESDPENSDIYLNLGRIYLLQGKPVEAISIFREGLSRGPNDRITAELERIGTRRLPPLPFLRRESPLNKYLGLLLARLGVR